MIWARIYERVWKWGRGGTTGGDLDRAGLRNEVSEADSFRLTGTNRISFRNLFLIPYLSLPLVLLSYHLLLVCIHVDIHRFRQHSSHPISTISPDSAHSYQKLIPLILLTILVPSILFLLLLPIKTFTFFNTYSIPFTCSRVGKFILGNSVAGLGDIMIDGGGGVVVWWMIGGWWIVGRVIGWMGIGGDAGAGAGGEWALLKVVCMGR